MGHGFPSIDWIWFSTVASAAAVTDGYETVFEFEANFKRTAKQSDSGCGRRGHVSNALPAAQRLDQIASANALVALS
jgi:hypothetical protein